MEGGRERSVRDKSSSVERWQGRSWMQPLWAWWLIAPKMSTSPPCSQCNHSAQGVFKNTAAPTSRGGDGACCCAVLKRAYATVLWDPEIKKKGQHNVPVWELLWFTVEKFVLSFVPSCLALTDYWLHCWVLWEKMSKKCKRAADYATPLFIVALSQFILNSFALSTQLELKHDIELKLNIKKRKVSTIPGFGETLPTLLVNEFWWFCYQNFSWIKILNPNLLIINGLALGFHILSRDFFSLLHRKQPFWNWNSLKSTQYNFNNTISLCAIV